MTDRLTKLAELLQLAPALLASGADAALEAACDAEPGYEEGMYLRIKTLTRRHASEWARLRELAERYERRVAARAGARE